MTIRSLTVSLLLAVLAAPAYGGVAYAQDNTPAPTTETTSQPTAQDNPQTRQTDEEENDYRRSQRRRDTGDIFDDIDINTRSSGGGGILGPEVKAIDQLDQESRRHLNKNRARALAEANPGEAIDAAYEPSETAKTDEYVAKQEEAAWEEMMDEANSGIGIIQGPKGSDQGIGTVAGTGASAGGGQGDQTGEAGGGQAGQAGQGQAGGGQTSQRNTSPLRGGSSSSASSILDQLKGRTSGGGRAPRIGQTAGGGQAPSGQASSGQTKGQDQGDAQAEAQSQNSSPSNSDGQSASDASAQAAAQSEAQSEAQSRAEAQAAAEENAANAAAEAAAHRETIRPLERLKRDPVERDTTGGRTSASDYLNRGKKN